MDGDVRGCIFENINWVFDFCSISRTDVSGKVFAGLYNFDNSHAISDTLPKVIWIFVNEWKYRVYRSLFSESKRL